MTAPPSDAELQAKLIEAVKATLAAPRNSPLAFGWFRFDEIEAVVTKLNAAQEQVRQYAEAVREYRRTTGMSNKTAEIAAHQLLLALAASPPDGASALSEVEKLRDLLEKAVPHISRSIFNPTNNDDWYARGMRLQEEIRAVLGERSTSEGEGS